MEPTLTQPRNRGRQFTNVLVQALDVGSLGKSRAVGPGAELGALYDPATLLAYYTSLMRYQSLLQAPPPVPGPKAALSSFLATSSSLLASSSSQPPPNTSILSHPAANQPAPSKVRPSPFPRCCE